MRNTCARAAGPSAACGIELRTVWNVDERPAYDVRRSHASAPILIAIRTRAGLGRMELLDGRAFDLPRDTLVVVENERIARYHCASERWAFWWFEHRIEGVLPYPLYTRIPCRTGRDEPSVVARIMTSLRHPDAAHRMHASALFLELATRWSRERPHAPHASRRQPAVQHAIDEMHRRMGTRWTVADMARHTGISERLFRKVFREVTGQSPKRFQDRLRLDAATELLNLGALSVKEVAARLGFANPFHLSRVYRSRLGVPPSRVARADAQPPTSATPRNQEI